MEKWTIYFDDLWIGDRFEAHGEVWTKLSSTTARMHPKEELALGNKGYGYIGSSICSFDQNDQVIYLPVEQS